MATRYCLVTHRTFVFSSSTLAITEIMSGSNTASANLNGDWWELTNTGTDTIDISGFSYDDNSFNAGTVTFPTQTIAGGASIVVWDGLSADEDAFRAEWLLILSNPLIDHPEFLMR